jgi:hypothetical protein
MFGRRQQWLNGTNRIKQANIRLQKSPQTEAEPETNYNQHHAK